MVASVCNNDIAQAENELSLKKGISVALETLKSHLLSKTGSVV